MKTRALLIVAVLVATYACLANEIVIINPPRIFQIADEMSVLARIDEYSIDPVYIVGFPSGNLYEGSNVPANFGNKVLLIATGVFRYESVIGSTNQIRKMMWIHPNRLGKQESIIPELSFPICGYCGGLGRKFMSECDNCKGEGRKLIKKNKAGTAIYIDRRLVDWIVK